MLDKERRRDYYKRNKERIKLLNSAKRTKLLNYHRTYYKLNKEKLKKDRLLYYKNNKLHKKDYIEKNKIRKKHYDYIYNKKKLIKKKLANGLVDKIDLEIAYILLNLK